MEQQTVHEETGEIDTPTLRMLGLPNLIQIVTEDIIDADKIQRARDRTAIKMQKIKAKVDSYLEKANLDDLSWDPDIVNEQIQRAERQMHKIAKFIWEEMIVENGGGENEDSQATYVQKLELVNDILNQEIKKGNQKKF